MAQGVPIPDGDPVGITSTITISDIGVINSININVEINTSDISELDIQLGHEQLQTTMVYLDITIKQELKALATLEDENDKKVSKKWKNIKGGLAEFCGGKSVKK